MARKGNPSVAHKGPGKVDSVKSSGPAVTRQSDTKLTTTDLGARVPKAVHSATAVIGTSGIADSVPSAWSPSDHYPKQPNM